MKKYFVSLVVFVSMLTSPLAIASAAYSPFGAVCTDTKATTSAVCSEKRTDNPVSGTHGILVKITQLIAFIAGLAAVIVIIISGIRMITSNGDSNSVGSARKAILDALIGLVVIVLAQSIIVFILDRVK